ncbi:MAG TPA: substrate-binding domain-containing protein, partial [Candidatus Olsenella stercoravium]|nr:substrate-binding domain-containing protein [Candidatus Olsenella stercoravium]
PGDLSLVGFDDTSFSRFSVPRITTIRQGSERLGERAAQILLDALDGSPAVHEVVPFQLIERESVA